MGKLFGTDGVRGVVNKDLNCEIALKIGSAVARTLKKEMDKKTLTFLIGSDTRISKDMFTSAVAAGVISEGCNIVNVGVLPTPAISYLTRLYEMDGAFVISASHNPSEYNGIKVLDSNGIKLSDELELECEKIILDGFETNKNVNECGLFRNNEKAIDDYIDYLTTTINHDISNIKILIDTANGAASVTAPKLFKKLNANFDLINDKPDGLNINKDAGSTHIEGLKKKVVSGKYDIGISYDGDADRTILVDELGNEIDGDYIIAITGYDLKKEGKLTNNTLVGTIMTNLGFIKFCEDNDINFVATSVGDKYVLQEMMKSGYIIGGEQSGHIIFKELANTGDGQMTSLQILNIMSKDNKKLSELAAIMHKYPQVLINANVSKEGKELYRQREDIHELINKYEQKMHGDGRIVVRPSGTESYIRVMIEGKNVDKITNTCQEIVDYIEKELNDNKNKVKTLSKK